MGETISALSAPRVQTGMVNGSTWTFAKPRPVNSLHRPLARPSLRLRRGEPLADLGRETFDDVPGPMVVRERVLAQRDRQDVRKHRRRKRRNRLLRGGRSGGEE